MARVALVDVAHPLVRARIRIRFDGLGFRLRRLGATVSGVSSIAITRSASAARADRRSGPVTRAVAAGADSVRRGTVGGRTVTR